MAPDHYEVLGVDPSARSAEIRAAYRQMMREHHPDLRPGDPLAEEMSRRITAAWTVLGRPASRAAYDRVRSARMPAALPSRPAPPPRPAYSAEGTAYRRAFDAASLKLAAAVLLLGVIVLLGLSR